MFLCCPAVSSENGFKGTEASVSNGTYPSRSDWRRFSFRSNESEKCVKSFRETEPSAGVGFVSFGSSGSICCDLSKEESSEERPSAAAALARSATLAATLAARSASWSSISESASKSPSGPFPAWSFAGSGSGVGSVVKTVSVTLTSPPRCGCPFSASPGVSPNVLDTSTTSPESESFSVSVSSFLISLSPASAYRPSLPGWRAPTRRPFPESGNPSPAFPAFAAPGRVHHGNEFRFVPHSFGSPAVSARGARGKEPSEAGTLLSVSVSSPGSARKPAASARDGVERVPVTGAFSTLGCVASDVKSDTSSRKRALFRAAPSAARLLPCDAMPANATAAPRMTLAHTTRVATA
mmetsp:Transcript_9806/g.36431  ORF Transcript_9806/g.36431 Transcript_9806/m.36431 type:complete len:352 (+) Transcript_9806:1141-2196(+)